MPFDECLEHYTPIITYRVRSILATNPTFGLTIEEGFQEARLALNRVYERAKTEEITNFDGYLFLSVKNRLSDAATGNRRRTVKQNDEVKQEFVRDSLYPEHLTEVDHIDRKQAGLVEEIGRRVSNHDLPVLEYLVTPPPDLSCAGCLRKKCLAVCNVAHRLERTTEDVVASVERIRSEAMPVISGKQYVPAPPKWKKPVIPVTNSDLMDVIMGINNDFTLKDVGPVVAKLLPKKSITYKSKIRNILFLMHQRGYIKMAAPRRGPHPAVFSTVKPPVTNDDIIDVVMGINGSFSLEKAREAVAAGLPGRDVIFKNKVPAVLYIMKKRGYIKVVTPRVGASSATFARAR